MLCAGIMAWARWARSSDSNALVLQAREEALMAEQEKQRILAANMERDRISASIQAEVTATLNSVINQAVDGIRMLDRAEAQGKEPTARFPQRSKPLENRGVPRLSVCANCLACFVRLVSAMTLTPVARANCS